MPPQLTYPGVYIEEIPSGIRAITGVATSITAFVGRAKRGPVNEPVTINGFGDYERVFGGLWTPSTMSFAVRDFFLNGGTQAIIVRLFNPDGGQAISKATLTVDNLGLEAANEGFWGNFLRARVDLNTKDTSDKNLFNLTVKDTSNDRGQIETFRNVSIQVGAPRQVDSVLEQESVLVRVKTPLPGNAPAPTPTTKGEDLFSDKNSVGVAGKPTDGKPLIQGNYDESEDGKKGIYALAKADLFNILCIPPFTPDDGGDVTTPLWSEATAYCEKRRAMLLVDAPSTWTVANAQAGLAGMNLSYRNAALFFPRLREVNPEHDYQIEDFAPCGAVAGVFARTDTERGVWKAPAGLDATLMGVEGLSVSLTDAENGQLNPHAINCLRAFPVAGEVVWGARTLRGDDSLADEYKYIPVRRLALFLEESLYRGTKWVVFEPNDEPLWAKIRLNIKAFMMGLFRQNAFQGSTPDQAFFVKCDHETTTPTDQDLGVVNILVGFAPLKPAEFVVLKIQQMAGQQ